ncbi:MAG: RNA polymerase sigma factor [bacterium]
MPAILHENRHDHMSDEQLAALARGGDPRAWEVFVRRHGARLLAYCIRLCGDGDDARVAWLSCLEETWARLRVGPGDTRPCTSAFAAATRLCAANAASVPASTLRLRDTGSFEARSQRLRECLLGLPFPQRAALGLCYFDNLPYAEAQRCLGPERPDARLLCAKGYAALATALGPNFLSEGLE